MNQGVNRLLYDVARRIDEEASIFSALRTFEQNRDDPTTAILNPDSLKAIALTIGRSLPVSVIGEQLGISKVSAYKLVEKLTNLGLLAETRKLRTSTHGRALGYTATMKTGAIVLKDGRLEVHCISKEGRECFSRDVITMENIGPDTRWVNADCAPIRSATEGSMTCPYRGLAQRRCCAEGKACPLYG